MEWWNIGMDTKGVSAIFVIVAALWVGQPTKALTEVLGFAGVGSQNCNVVSQNAIPGRGSEQNFMTQIVFMWVQGYMSGFVESPTPKCATGGLPTGSR